MQTVWSLLDFLGKAVIVVAAFGACAAIIGSRTRRRKEGLAPVRLTEIAEPRKRRAEHLKRALLSDADRKAAEKEAKAADKQKKKQEKKAGEPRTKTVFVIDFDGDIRASAVEALREEVTTIVGIAQPEDEVVARIESPGGTVHGYGLAASQLARLRDKNIALTVCVDKVAASGGYMMACVAQKIVAAPFAIVGSIGVVASLPNAHKALEKLGIEYRDVTAGEYKRTVSVFGPVREEGLAKLQSQIEETHELFKAHIHAMRPALDIGRVATGEHWYGTRALELGLVDELGTSDDVLLAKGDGAKVYEVRCEAGRSMRSRIAGAASAWLGQIA
jgi:serine protease SohB